MTRPPWRPPAIAGPTPTSPNPPAPPSSGPRWAHRFRSAPFGIDLRTSAPSRHHRSASWARKWKQGPPADPLPAGRRDATLRGGSPVAVEAGGDPGRQVHGSDGLEGLGVEEREVA